MGQYVSEALFGRRLARHPPAYRRARFGPAQPLAGQAPWPRPAKPERSPRARPELTRPAGMVLIITGTVLLLAVSIPLPFLNLKLLGLVLLVAGLIKVRVPQRACGWLWLNRRDVMTALDAPTEEATTPRVPLDILLDSSPAAAPRPGGGLAQSGRLVQGGGPGSPASETATVG